MTGLAAFWLVVVLVVYWWLSRPVRCPRNEQGVHDFSHEHEGRIAICRACGHVEDLR